MPLQMTTTFIDTVTGEEYEFLGTSIQFSEKELIALEQQHDQEIDSFVQQLIDDGYFEEEWEEAPEQENETIDHHQPHQQQQIDQQINQQQIDQIIADKSYEHEMDFGETSNEETSESDIGPDETDDDDDDEEDEDNTDDDEEEIVYINNKENECINSKRSQSSYIVSTAYSSKTTKKVDLSKFYSPSCSLKKNHSSLTRKTHLPLQSMQININGICIRNIMLN